MPTLNFHCPAQLQSPLEKARAWKKVLLPGCPGQSETKQLHPRKGISANQPSIGARMQVHYYMKQRLSARLCTGYGQKKMYMRSIKLGDCKHSSSLLLWSLRTQMSSPSDSDSPSSSSCQNRFWCVCEYSLFHAKLVCFTRLNLKQIQFLQFSYSMYLLAMI